jgi:purine-cytosine permease-like protein
MQHVDTQVGRKRRFGHGPRQFTSARMAAMSDNTASKFFSKFATIADLSGKPGTFVLAVTIVVVWAVSGPFFGYSENWRLVINTSTTIITFLMVSSCGTRRTATARRSRQSSTS